MCQMARSPQKGEAHRREPMGPVRLPPSAPDYQAFTGAVVVLGVRLLWVVQPEVAEPHEPFWRDVLWL